MHQLPCIAQQTDDDSIDESISEAVRDACSWS